MKSVDLEKLRYVAMFCRDKIRDCNPGVLFDAVAEIEKLRAIVAKLPHSADGKCIHENTDLWLPACYYGKVIKMRAPAFSLVAQPVEDYGFCHKVSKCYSTPEAAKEAANA